jgi:hypothetical protein
MRQLGGVNVMTAVFLLPAKSRPEIARASIVLPRLVSRAACPSESVVMWPQCPRSAQEGHAVPHETRPGDGRMIQLTNGEGGMSAPPPSTAHVLERASVKLAVHEQGEVDLTGQRCRTGLLQD